MVILPNVIYLLQNLTIIKMKVIVVLLSAFILSCSSNTHSVEKTEKEDEKCTVKSCCEKSCEQKKSEMINDILKLI